MQGSTYTVVLTAFEEDVGTPDEIAPRLCEVFGIEAQRARWTLENLPFQVVAGADLERAERYHNALRALGGLVELRPDGTPMDNMLEPVAADPFSPPSGAPGVPEAAMQAVLSDAQALSQADETPFQLLGNHDPDEDAAPSDADSDMLLEPLATTDHLPPVSDSDPVPAGIAPHAIGPNARAPRAPADVRRGRTSQSGSQRPVPSLVGKRKRSRRPASVLSINLGRGFHILLVAAAWVVVWMFVRDRSVTVDSELGSHEFKYIHRLSDSAKADAELPLIVALHGNGDTPGDFYDALLSEFEEPARFVLFRAPKETKGLTLFGSTWPDGPPAISRYAPRLADAIQLLTARYPTRCKPILLGYSGGAHIVYHLAANRAGDFSLVVPIAGRLYPELVPRIRPWEGDGAPVRAFHGTKDTLVGFRHGQSATEALLKLGVDVTMQPLAGGHQAPFSVGRYRLLELLQRKTTTCDAGDAR